MQSMQPSVRSTSPIAEHDQRTGMMGFEGFEPGDASFAGVGSEAGAEHGDILQPPAPPSAMTAGETRIATVQRKVASPPAAMAGSPASTARGEVAAADAQMQARIQPSEPWAVRSVAPVPSVTRNVSDHSKQLASLSSEIGVPDRADAHDVSLSPSGLPVRSPASSIDGIHPEELSLGDSQTGSAPRRFGPGVVHTRSIRQTRQIDSTRLEPSPGALAEHFKPLLERAGEPGADADEGPRVVIGRINVEVVSPPARPPSTAAPRPGPLTAASVSVIGPLGGGVSSNLRLSLRHR
jgi:hypothetical protein